MDAASIITALQETLPGASLKPSPPGIVRPSSFPATVWWRPARVLRDDRASLFQVLTEVTAVDWWPAEPRFVVVYHLLSPRHLHLLRLKVRLSKNDPHVSTVSGVWPSANWLEREVWDLFGVVFEGHPDLRRLMMPDDWEGHPFRKDYPVQIKMKPKVYEPLQVTEQEFEDRIIADRRVRAPKKS